MIKIVEKLYRKYYPKQLKSKADYQFVLKGKKGIEIGGPSEIFTQKGLLPIYDDLQSVDGCNYSTETVWEGRLIDGADFIYKNKKNTKGIQWVAEGTDLNRISNGQYEVVLSCHNLEHIANPLKALEEWKRVLTMDGFLLLVLPHKDLTFDHNRVVTSMDHLISDYREDITENDQTHFEEIIALHDLDMDLAIDTRESLKLRLEYNIFNRCAHHHVFNTPLVAQLLNEANFQIRKMDVMYHNIFALAQKSIGKPNNNAFLSGEKVGYSKKHLYPSDQFSA